MSNLDYDSLINQLKRSTKDPKANLALGKLSQMLQTREGQELAQSFMQSADPNAMARAAQCAQAGDLEGAKAALSQILSTPQGSAAAANIVQKLKK